MSRSRAGQPESEIPETLLRKASLAKTAGLRAKYARRGLDQDGPIDPSTRALLLRQLYLAAMERRRFSEAREFAHEMVALAVVPDAAHQDAARACLGQKDVDGAIRHLRMAARLGPASRRAFHLSMLGALLYLNGRATEARNPLRLAVRWSTTDKSICRAQLLLAEIDADHLNVDDADIQQDLLRLREELETSDHQRGYAEFVLGEICVLLDDQPSATAYFDSFLARTAHGRVAMQVALQGEIRHAKRHLALLKRRLDPA
ncbi:MAG TPA: tetratricopeptide repeat protein [Polyangiaceae bacterium]